MLRVIHADALDVLRTTPDASVDLVYVDPPFGTGSKQVGRSGAYDDPDDALIVRDPWYIHEFHRVLKSTGTMYLHLDWRSSHYARLECDRVFGSTNFLNEVVWAYNYGGRGKDRWPRKHDTILVYARNVGDHVFDWDAVDRVPYKAPGMQHVGRSPAEAEARIARGQVPTDVWTDIPIIGTSSRERTGYPTQKPVRLLERIVVASSPPGGTVLDVFAGSGTTGAACLKTGRDCVLVDKNPQALAVMKERFGDVATWS